MYLVLLDYMTLTYYPLCFFWKQMHSTMKEKIKKMRKRKHFFSCWDQYYPLLIMWLWKLIGIYSRNCHYKEWVGGCIRKSISFHAEKKIAPEALYQIKGIMFSNSRKVHGKAGVVKLTNVTNYLWWGFKILNPFLSQKYYL